MGWEGAKKREIERQLLCEYKACSGYKRHTDISLGRVYWQLMSRMDGNIITASLEKNVRNRRTE